MSDLFKNNPELKEYFETSDGEKFYSHNLAANHAKGLEDKEVKTVTKPESKKASKDEKSAEDKGSKTADAAADQK